MPLSLRALSVILLLFCAGVCVAQPVANFTATPSSGCAPLVAQFTSTSTGTNASTVYSWNLGNTVLTNSQNPSTSYTSPGAYTVTLTVSGPGGSSTKTATVNVYAAPVVSFTASPSAGCAPLNVTFTSSVTANAPGGVLYTWSYGDGTFSSTAGANPTHAFTYASTFGVTLSVTNSNNCTSTIVIPAVTTYPKPSSAFSVPSTSLCALPATVNFTSANASGVNYAWTFGDGTSGSGPSPSHTYTTANTYTVTLIATDGNGCKDTLTQNSYLHVQANNASFSAPASACDSTLAPFSNTSAGVTGFTKWWFGDGTTDTGKNINHFYTASNTYTVTMVTEIGSCTDTVTKTITINPKPVVGITHDVPCLPGSMTFTASTSVPVATYNWVWASGGSATGNPVTHAYGGPRIDTAYLIVGTGAGCADTIVDYNVYAQDVIPHVDFLQKGCAPLTTTFNCDSVPCTSIPCIPLGVGPCFCHYPFNIVSCTWWVDGVLQTTTSFSITRTFVAPGTHTVILKTITANGCVQYNTFYVCGGVKIKPSFYAYPDTVVCVKQPVWFQNTTGDTTIKYTWFYGTNELDTNNGDYNGYHRYKFPKTDTVMLVSEVCGCFDTAVRYNYITVRPSDAHFKDSIYCPPSKTVAITNQAVGATTEYWDFGDGTTSTSANPPPHTYLNYGFYTITHITSNSTYGCRDTVTDTVRLIPGGINFTADTTICTGDTLHLNGIFSGLKPYAYSWYLNSNPLSGLITRSTFLKADTPLLNRGLYTVTWIAMSGEGGRCKDSLTKPNWAIVSHPIAGFSASPRIGCTPLPVLFLDTTSYTPTTQGQTRSWLFGDGGAGTVGTAGTTHTYTTAGIYTVTLKVTDWIGCSDSVTRPAYISARHPIALFSASTVNACLHETVNFGNLSTGATALQSHWDYGDGTTDTAHNGSHAYSATGTYTVRLIVIDSTGCRDTATISTPINVTHPVAKFALSDTLAVCPPLIISFTDQSAGGPTAWAWDFGNGSSAVIANPASTYVNPGVYAVRLIVYDANACSDTANAYVRVLGYSGALSYTPLAGCVPLTVNFTANVSGVPVMVWDFSDGDTALATATTYAHTYRNSGVYVPKLIFYDGKGCRNSSSGLDTIKVDEVFAGFKVLPPCERTLLTLTDTSRSLFSTLASWRWDFGGGQVATGPTTTRVYPTPGQYPVTLIVSNTHGCIDTLTRNVTIYPLPVITGSPDTAVCPPDAVTISASGGSTYTWAPGATLSCTSCTTPKAAPTVPTAYIVTGTDSNGCANKATVKIGIQTKTTFSVVSGGEICLGEHFHLAASGATVYTWTPAGTLSNADSSGTIATPTATTTYVATGREGSCAADTHSVRIVVNPLASIDAGSDERVVAGNSVALQASGTGIDHLLWKDDPTLSCTDCYGPYASPRATTTYYVTAYTTKGCTSTDSMTVRVLCDGSQLFIPNTFTPNSDGVNDYFYIQGRGIDIVNSFRVYSRWGELLYERKGMSVNSEYEGWNGTYNGQKLPPDVYVYIIEATCDNGSPIKWKGDVTLIR